ncbi:MAG: hypothetical protein AUI10_03695 [Actinobacteria bacterium 13_2_20CM_2_72_6]|nr:MAG: hypothetical protein AUI10_03695 [Actinobacteria bacterium 13_2_20CM_2_72_6]
MHTFVSDSCTTRYAVRSGTGASARAAPSTATSMRSPDRRNEATSSSSPARPAVGSVGAGGSPGSRSSPMVSRSSSSAVRLARRMWPSACRACPGWSARTWSATAACTVMRASWWPRTSCRSRAIRSRSSATRRRASCSRPSSARRARSSTSRVYARRVRDASPAATASAPSAASARFSAPSQYDGFTIACSPAKANTASAPMMSARRRLPVSATV